ncbi:GNAT family N-acetyltransferase [Thioalkalivibrio denitrificans]|nr:GNAT family N-acetyltransferase [Thioalkalivibrio denitrificans]
MEQTVWLPIRFGYKTLAEPKRRMQVLKLHFTEIRPEHVSALIDEHPEEDCLIRALPIDAPLPRISRFQGRLRFVQRQYQRHYIDLTTTWDDYQARFSPKTLQGMRRKLRKFERESGGTIDWRTYRTPEEMETFYRLAREVSSRTYQERLLDAGLPTEETFRQRMIERAAEGRVHGYLLFLHDAPIAYLYCPVDDGILEYAYLGYLQEHATLSPGTVLQWLVVEALYGEGGYRMFDFSAGEGAHKAMFGKDSLCCADVFLLQPTGANRLLVYAQAFVSTTSSFASRVLNRLQLKAHVKRLIRQT